MMRTFNEIVDKEMLNLQRDKEYQEFIKWTQKPWWVRQSEEGDYMADGSDLQPYEPEEAGNE